MPPVRLEMSGRTVDEFRTGSDGRFQLKAEASGSLRVVVTAAGFAEVIAPVSLDSRYLQVTLQPAPFFEAVNVTSSRTDLPRADPAVTMTVLPAVELLTSAALTLDDALKMVPASRCSVEHPLACRILRHKVSRCAALAAPAQAVRWC